MDRRTPLTPDELVDLVAAYRDGDINPTETPDEIKLRFRGDRTAPPHTPSEAETLNETIRRRGSAARRGTNCVTHCSPRRKGTATTSSPQWPHQSRRCCRRYVNRLHVATATYDTSQRTEGGCVRRRRAKNQYNESLRVFDTDGTQIGRLDVANYRPDKSHTVQWMEVPEEHRRQGIMAELLEHYRRYHMAPGEHLRFSATTETAQSSSRPPHHPGRTNRPRSN